MTQPIESVVKVAATPSQAKIHVAMLQAAGIPARVEGDSLVDEFATARSMMNLMGTRVMVPTQSLGAAREVLQPAAIDPAELERQALAAPTAESMPQRAGWPTPRGRPFDWIVLVLVQVLPPLLALAIYALLT